MCIYYTSTKHIHILNKIHIHATHLSLHLMLKCVRYCSNKRAINSVVTSNVWPICRENVFNRWRKGWNVWHKRFHPQWFSFANETMVYIKSTRIPGIPIHRTGRMYYEWMCVYAVCEYVRIVGYTNQITVSFNENNTVYRVRLCDG